MEKKSACGKSLMRMVINSISGTGKKGLAPGAPMDPSVVPPEGEPAPGMAESLNGSMITKDTRWVAPASINPSRKESKEQKIDLKIK